MEPLPNARTDRGAKTGNTGSKKKTGRVVRTGGST